MNDDCEICMSGMPPGSKLHAYIEYGNKCLYCGNDFVITLRNPVYIGDFVDDEGRLEHGFKIRNPIRGCKCNPAKSKTWWALCFGMKAPELFVSQEVKALHED